MQYKEWEKEAAVKEAMRAPELEILKRWRHREISCNECFGGSFWGGSAITGWQCEICKTDHMHGNTNTPRICVGCAISNFKCQRCTKSLDESL